MANFFNEQVSDKASQYPFHHPDDGRFVPMELSEPRMLTMSMRWRPDRRRVARPCSTQAQRRHDDETCAEGSQWCSPIQVIGSTALIRPNRKRRSPRDLATVKHPELGHSAQRKAELNRPASLPATTGLKRATKKLKITFNAESNPLLGVIYTEPDSKLNLDQEGAIPVATITEAGAGEELVTGKPVSTYWLDVRIPGDWTVTVEQYK